MKITIMGIVYLVCIIFCLVQVYLSIMSIEKDQKVIISNQKTIMLKINVLYRQIEPPFELIDKKGE